MKEFEIISKYFKPLAAGFAGSLGLTDDVAIIPKNKTCDYIITCDGMVEGVHFFKDSAPEIIASRLMASNLSDIASSGGVPKFYLLTGSIKSGMNEKWFKKFSETLAKFNKEYGIFLLGGDTVKSSNELFFSVTMIGEVPRGKALLRSCAVAGDDIYVSGEIGGGYLGLIEGLKVRRLEGIDNPKNLNTFTPSNLQTKYNSPTPRISLGEKLLNVANSCTDISDGLLRDLENICKTSEVFAEIYLDKIPLALKGKLIEEQITGGDDYELIFTAPNSKKAKIEKISRELGIKISNIGKIQTKNAKFSKKHGYIQVLDSKGDLVKFNKKGYEHEIN